MSSINTNQPLIDAFFSQICATRRQAQLTNVPPLRYDNLAVSPYLAENGGYTKTQLDMRRKAEILTYNSNRNLQTNGLTKSQKYSIIMKSSTTTTPVYKSQCFSNETGQFIMTPSSSCDVPGNVIQLFNDQTIPLYNFTLGNNTKSITANEDLNYYYQ